jgi:hypothetical protein
MSVDSPRLAAAQRTAAGKRGASRRRRWTRLASWGLIVPMLALFSFSVVANARNVGKPDYAQALSGLQRIGPLVLVKSTEKPILCSVTQNQAAALAVRWKTSSTMLPVNGQDIPAIWVDAPSTDALRDFLGGTTHCQFVREKGIFYLPFNANLS